MTMTVAQIMMKQFVMIMMMIRFVMINDHDDHGWVVFNSILGRCIICKTFLHYAFSNVICHDQ